MRATVLPDPRVARILPDGSEITSVDELNIKGRSLNRPFPRIEVVQIGVCRSFFETHFGSDS